MHFWQNHLKIKDFSRKCYRHNLTFLKVITHFCFQFLEEKILSTTKESLLHKMFLLILQGITFITKKSKIPSLL